MSFIIYYLVNFVANNHGILWISTSRCSLSAGQTVCLLGCVTAGHHGFTCLAYYHCVASPSHYSHISIFPSAPIIFIIKKYALTKPF